MNENTAAQETTDFVDDGWGDEAVDLSDVTDEPEDAEQETPAEENQPEAEGEDGEKSEEQAEDKPAEEADHSFVLNYMGENRTVTRDEAIALAQKGMDYDRIRQSRDEVITEKDRLQKSLAPLDELAKSQGITLEQLVDNAHVAALMQKDNLSAEAARERVQLERRAREISEREAALKQKEAQDDTAKAEADKRTADIRKFIEAYPEIDPKSIPKEVWAQVSKGSTLTEAYARHESAQLKLALEAEKKNRENAARSAGSRTTDGKDDKKDLIDKYWDEDD